MPISENLFQKCSPAIGSDLARCGAITNCNLSIPTPEELDSIFLDSESNFRLMHALFRFQMEANACQIKQNGLFDLIMANADTKRRLSTDTLPSGLIEIRPFIQVKREGRINNEYWFVTNGEASGETNWQVDVASGTNIPADVRWFPADDRVFIEGRTDAGISTHTAYTIVSSALVGAVVRLVLESLNENSNLDETRLTDPTEGVLTRGTANKSPFEAYCQQIPGLNTNDLVPAWVEDTRVTICRSERYREYFNLLRSDNKYFELFGDIEEAKYNKQVMEDWQRRWVQQWFWGKKAAGQELNDYQTSLEQIVIPTTAGLALPFEAECVGYRANAEGVYEQLAECGAVFDGAGEVFNLQEFFQNVLYNIMRYRQANSSRTTAGKIRIETITDSFFRRQIQIAMIRYFNVTMEGLARFTVDWNKSNPLGFNWDTYNLDYPQIEWTVMSHPYFDDLVDARKRAGLGDGHDIWTLDWSDIKTSILGTQTAENKSGTAQQAALVDDNMMCVMQRPTKSVKMMNTKWTVYVQCPRSHNIIENLSPAIPEHAGTSTTGTPYDYIGDYVA